MINALFSILIFPGMLFLSVFSLAAEYVDRKLYARLQNRVGPPWFQPFADFVKLLGKEEIIPQQASLNMFKLAPVVAFTSVITAFLYIPMWKAQSLFSFSGDVIVVLYLLTIPTLAFFIGGWYSTSLYARIGAVRSLTQLFAYEVPLFVGILGAALLANTWSLSEIMVFYGRHPWYWLFNIIGFLVSLTALMGKLEKAPFDIPEAETEIVAGSFVEYGGRLLAFIRLTFDCEMIAGAALLVAVFLPFGLVLNPYIGFVIFILKILLIIAILSLFRTIFARLRIDQMVVFCWKYVAPLSILQVLINLVLKGTLAK
jgi:NADH-quinone oxidoreductase subunit H